MAGDRAPLLRCGAVGLAATGVEAVLVGWLLPDLPDLLGAVPAGAASFEAWLVAGCEVAALLATTWLWVLVVLVVVEAAGPGRRRGRGVPAVVRRLVLAACGAGLAGSLLGPATAAAPPPSPLDGLPLPDRATSHAVPAQPRAPGPAPAARRTTPSARTVDVVAGDTLWDLAEADLPAHASAAEIDARWRAIHAANRGVIGPDPGLILPGQRLRLPDRPSDT
jgi:hypothetical protein